MSTLRLHAARTLRILARRLDPEVRPLRIDWSDGRRLTLPAGWTLEQALDLVRRIDDPPREAVRRKPAPDLFDDYVGD